MAGGLYNLNPAKKSLLRRRLFSGEAPFDVTSSAGIVAAWDMGTVYQEAELYTAANDGDPIGGIPDLRGNGNILSRSGSSRPTRRSGGGLFWAEFDGTDDYLDLTLPVGQRTNDMTLLLAVEFDAAETNMAMLSDGGSTSQPFVGLGLDGNAGAPSGSSGSVTIHIDNGATLSTRNAVRDALVAAGKCIWEARNIDLTTGAWNAVADPVMFTLGGVLYLSDLDFYRGIWIDNTTISPADATAARAWVAEGIGE